MVVALAAVALVPGCGGGEESGGSDWPFPNQNLASTRAVSGGPIDSGSVSRLKVRWRFPLRGGARESGIFTANPVVAGDMVYVQDMLSNVFALSRKDGGYRWARWFRYGNPGPNGLAYAEGRVYGSTDTSAFALDADTGRTLWIRRILTPVEHYVDIAPVVANGLVYTSTIGYPPGGRGALYALDARTGAVRWKFVTILGEWRFPREAGGGGAWFPLSVDADGRVYAGNSNPGPWGGSRARPNGGAFPGPALYTDSLLVLDGRTGRLLWHDQVTPHDVRDYDFQVSPILTTVGGKPVVVGAGKAGRVIAWERRTSRRIWEAGVGMHLNDEGPLPPKRVTVCPGLLGGVETPMAHADGRIFVPVVDLCAYGSAFGYQSITTVDASLGRGELVALDAATGRRVWRRRFGQPVFSCATVANDVVFTATFDGRIYALEVADGSILWTARARAGINACPAVAGDLLLVGAGMRHPAFPNPRYELIAFGLD